MAATLETTEERRAKRSPYTEADIARALTEVAICAGSPQLASKRLKEQGRPIPRSTLEFWQRQAHAEKYQKIRSELVPRIHARVATECEDLAIAYAETEAKALAQFHDQLGDLAPRDMAGAIRNLATGKAINVDKAALLRNRPTSIVEHRSVDDDLKWLSRHGVIDSTAEEIGEAEVVPSVLATQAQAGS